MEAVREIYSGGGASAFWAGTSAKMVESASKGLILMWSKESLLGILDKAHVSPGELLLVVVVERGKEDSLARLLARPSKSKKTEEDDEKFSIQPFLVETEGALRGPLFSNRLSDSRLASRPCFFF